MVNQPREKHAEYMRQWRKNKEVKESQRLEGTDEAFKDCKRFRFMVSNQIERDEDFMRSHFEECANCRFWFREMRARNERNEEREDPFNWHNWQSPEPEKEEKLDPNNQFLEDMWKNHGRTKKSR